MVLGVPRESAGQACRAYSFEIENGDGTKSVCMGCDLLRTGKCRRKSRLPIIGKIKLDPKEPEYTGRSNAMRRLAEKLKLVC